MDKHIAFINIYLQIGATLSSQYKDIEFLEYGSTLDELFIKFKLSEHREKDFLLKRMFEENPFVSQNLTFENSKYNVTDYIKILRTNNQNYLAGLYENFLKFGEYFVSNSSQLSLIKTFYNNRIFTYDYSKYTYIERLLEFVQFALLNVFKILNTRFEEQSYFTSLQTHLTFLFINLDALIKNMLSNEHYKDKLEHVINSVQIDSYERYRYKQVIRVDSLDKLIGHYRDIVCHLEEGNRLIDSVKKIFSGLMVSGYNIRYADGCLNVETHLSKFVSLISNLLIGELSVITINEKKSGKQLFTTFSFDQFDLFYPLIKQQYRIEKDNSDLIYTIFLKKIA